MSVLNEYTAGCIDLNGCHIKNENPYFYKERIFDPLNNPRYANNLGLPSLLIKENPIRGIVRLHVGPDFAGHHVHDGMKCAEQDTVVMEVGAREMRGMTSGARWFGDKSPYNRQSVAGDRSAEPLDAQILSTTCAAECALLDHFKVPPTCDAETYTGGNRMELSQYKELCFARDGQGCCVNDPRSFKLAIQYGTAKKGDVIPLTNNADVKVTIPILVDAKGFGFGHCTDASPGHL